MNLMLKNKKPKRQVSLLVYYQQLYYHINERYEKNTIFNPRLISII